ncbi:transcriptional regulator, AraC family [Clostridiales bacterium 1_7_47FAA]|uniref:Helix-turn-helix transcriptional regulator n=1 Tax=Enterocloster hominis (ex Hitch et al. 2024) TaxID=1917870 RepID=A0ABV1D3V6_9FIRM|nr:transcriptional regulator, AraC family [Clostridiales bacterium 1_7_47FAA]
MLLRRRMYRALIRLKETNLSINQIALMAGYGNNSNFYKAFREYYGMSPREYVYTES